MLVSLHPFFNPSSAALNPTGNENSPWFIGCVRPSDSSLVRLYSPKGAHDLDPVLCSVRCLDDGYQVAALTFESCYCGNHQKHGLVFSECFNTSSSEESESERQSALNLPVGGGQGTVALYRTEGPFLHSINVSSPADRVQPGRTFVVEVSGNLAGRPNQPTGRLILCFTTNSRVPSLAGRDLSFVSVEFLDTSAKGQSSHHVSILDDGSFFVSTDWILETPGKYEINVRVSNLLSTLFSTLQLSVLQPSPQISLLHGPLGVPSCQQPTSHSMTTQTAYVGDPVTLQAYVGEGPATGFCWCCNHKEREEERTCVKTTCIPNSECLNSTLVGCVLLQVVVLPAVSDLKVNVSRNQLRAGGSISLDVELFTTMKHLLVLNLTLAAEYVQCHENDIDLNSEGHVDNNSRSADSSYMNNDKTQKSKITDWKNSTDHDCNHGNNIHEHNLHQHHAEFYCHDGTRSHPHHSIPLHLLHSSHQSSCRLHLHLRCRLPTRAGQYHLMASVLSAPHPSSVLLSSALPQALKVYEQICALRLSGRWMSAVPTHVEFSLGVVSQGGRMGSRVIWTFSLDNKVVMNRTTQEWLINVSFALAGRYNVTVEAFNPVSRASFQTHILVQDPVGELALSVPRVIRTNQEQVVLFSVAAGSNMTVSLQVNTTLLYRNSSYTTGEEAAAVLLFDRAGTFVVQLQAENQVSSQNKSIRVCVEGNRKSSPQVTVKPNWEPPTSQSPAHTVWIYAAKPAYPTNTDITFLAVADASEPVEFMWHFGDSISVRTSSRAVTKRYNKPGRFDVFVVMSAGQSSVPSDVLPLVIQRVVKLNRLVHQASVLQNQTVTLSCRVNVGTDLTFHWSFGDGSSRLGQSTEQHVFHRTGEFRVEVTASNLVSSASLSSHIFVVDRPCQPPPVKNMGPPKLQVRRYEVICLGVTYETEIDCDTSRGLQYTWTLLDSAGRSLRLPRTDTHRQSLTLQSHFLQYDTYTATARVQVVGSVVYSNYSVRVQVMPSPPVVFIQGGTNVFINSGNTTALTLDGRRSYDPDFPMNLLSYSWTCKPLSSISTSCFHQHISTSSPVLTVPVGSLKRDFDQFQFTLTIRSGERSASTETFLTVKPNLIGKLSVSCPRCQGDQVNWDQSFVVDTWCEDCDVSLAHIQYTWSLFLVNASTRPVIEGRIRASLSNIVKFNISPTLSPGEEPLYHSPGEFYPAEHQPSTDYLSLTLDSSGDLDSEQLGISEFPVPSDLSAEWEFSFPVLEGGDMGEQGEKNNAVRVKHKIQMSNFLYFHMHGLWVCIKAESVTESDYDVHPPNAEEGDPGSSAGRPTGAVHICVYLCSHNQCEMLCIYSCVFQGVDGETLSAGEDAVFDPAEHESEGSNLVVSGHSVLIQEPTLLDLPRDPVDGDVFESYTYTGISSSTLRLRPFSLRPGSRYMLEVTAKCRSSFVGRTQLFLKTKPAPEGVKCQVQPVKGTELHTHFSIFCTSGKEDLLYEYSFSVGGGPRRVLYQGRDFQYYFSLPAGDASDDYKVTIYTEIRSSTYGTATKPCPVTVRVQPSFLRDASSLHDPDLELSAAGLKNLSALLQLGNSHEVRNYVSLVATVLNRLGLEAKANTHAQRLMRNVLICTVCELKSGTAEQESLVDSICILKDLLQVTNQVSLASVRHVTLHVRAISDMFLESSDSVRYRLDHKTLDTLLLLLSYILQAAVTDLDLTPESSNMDNITQVLESDSVNRGITGCCIPASSDPIKQGGSISAKQRTRLVDDILQTASDLMLKYIFLHKVQQHKFSTGLISLYAAYQNQTSTVISSGSTTFYMPPYLIQLLFVHGSGAAGSTQQQPCVLTVLTKLTLNPYTCAHSPTQLTGPVVDLSLYKCSRRRKIPVRSLNQPINVELQHPPRNKSSVREYILLRSQVNYHSFNITRDHLQQVIQLSVAFTPPPDRVFPITLLFRMFERPTPSMHHLQRTHHWESNSVRITLPSSYLNAAGVGHLALLNAHLGKEQRHKQLSEEISYSLTVVSSQCLNWDGHQGAWTHLGCRTWQEDTTSAVNCSCHQLRPLTVVQHQIQTRHDTAELDPLLSVSQDLTVLVVMVLCLCLYIPGLVACKRADDVSGKNGRVHYLSDNSPLDPHLYAVTIHTGVFSAASMSAKVYIVLYGEDGFSHTRELQVPGCTLFRRNSQDTFILSAADSLGSVWGVHIWHDGSGPFPNWYLKHVEVSEVNSGHVIGGVWLFVGQCWLSVNRGDGQVERTLCVCTHGIGFAKVEHSCTSEHSHFYFLLTCDPGSPPVCLQMLCFKLSDFLADFHIWMSVFRCPCPNLFTHTQRLSVCLLLLLGYACVNTVIISQMDDQLPMELGILDVSAISLTTGLLSVVAVLPGTTLISFLFRLHEVKLTRSEPQHAKGRKTENDDFEDALPLNHSVFHPSWSRLQQWMQETWRKKYQGTNLLPVSTVILENKEQANQSDVMAKKEEDPAVESSVGPVIWNLSLISKGENDDRATRGKDIDLSSESSKFCGTQKDVVSSMRDVDQDTQEKTEYPQGKRYHLMDKLNRRKVGRASQWCQSLAWTLCLLLSLSCLVLSAVLGMRFSSSKVLLWIHSLFLSLVSCIFFIQPAVILTVAVIVSCWYRNKTDFHTFSTIREFEIPLCSHSGANRLEESFRPPAFPQDTCSDLDTLLAARQRARYLRLVRPPNPAELRRGRGRKRRETLIHDVLRDLCVCVSMFALMLCVTYGSSFSHHHHLNKAVRKQLIWNDDKNFMSIKTHEDWWKWTKTGLLNLLYKNASTKTEQSHILMGEPILWKSEASSFQDQNSLRVCVLCVTIQVPSVTFVPERLRSFFSRSGASTYTHSNVKVATATPQSTCGRLGCYLGLSTTVGLGHTRSDATSKLDLLHSGGWLGRRTVALKVQFTLYSPAPNLFTSVTLLTEQSSNSVLVPSSKVQSVRVYHTPAVWDYVVMVCQLIFLLLSLLQLCLQACAMRLQGLMGHWRTPRNWLELTLLSVTLVYYVYYIYRSVIIMEAVELLQRHRGHADVSILASWEQDVRALRGVTLFLLTLKCVTVLSVNRTLASSAALLTRSLSSLLWPTLSGLILLVALSCVGNLLFAQSSWAFSSIPRSLQSLLCHYWGLRPSRSLHPLLSGRDFLYCVTLYLSSTVVWTAMVLSLVSALVRVAKRSQSRWDVLTLAELASYIRRRISEVTGQRELKWIDDHVESRTYYLEEFESLVDELLFRLNALSNCLHHTLPQKLRHDIEEQSPVTSPVQEPSNTNTQVSLPRVKHAPQTHACCACTHTYIFVFLLQEFVRRLVAEETIRSKLELEMLQRGGQRRKNPSSAVFLPSDALQKTGERDEENPNDRERQTYLKGHNCLSLLDSTSLIRIWTEDDLEKQTNDSSWLSKIQATHTEVVVEVLVHEEPGSTEAEKQEGRKV
ncbi:polycystin-1-like protein 1 [Paralichthys olivaceus]|uniref:polycystin-1-like protein 1 n=1 Tax=Paralichthys olivaceus TaxID=8255 RepID=UPI0037506D17